MNIVPVKSEMRYCEDIGMFSIDRPLTTCLWRTKFCKENCYNGKLYKLYKNMITKDQRNEPYWQSLDGESLSSELSRKKKQTKRFRLMTRGEGITNITDIDKIIDICNKNQSVQFWLPTRAWRNKELKLVIENKLFKIKNLFILASIDPSNNKTEIKGLINSGWSTMFFGDDEKSPIADSFLCPKTWGHKKGHCSKCKSGCFSKKQVHIWLKNHK